MTKRPRSFDATGVQFRGDDPNGYHKADNEFDELSIFLKDGKTLLVWGCPHCGMLKFQELEK